jgi:large subunit ribosomal protein L19
MRKIEELGMPTDVKTIPEFRSGDTVRVHVRILEGDKERIQVFEGIVIRRKRAGASSNFTVRKLSYGVGVERQFPLFSPLISKIEVKSRGKVRRSRLFYLRELRGKAARIKDRVENTTTTTTSRRGEQ